MTDGLEALAAVSAAVSTLQQVHLSDLIFLRTKQSDMATYFGPLLTELMSERWLGTSAARFTAVSTLQEVGLSDLIFLHTTSSDMATYLGPFPTEAESD